jgi:hypothetical protein
VQSIDGWVVDWLLGAGRVLRYRAAEVAADLLGPAVAGLPAADPRREPLQAALASVLLLLGRQEEAESLAERVLALHRQAARTMAVSRRSREPWSVVAWLMPCSCMWTKAGRGRTRRLLARSVLLSPSGRTAGRHDRAGSSAGRAVGIRRRC